MKICILMSTLCMGSSHGSRVTPVGGRVCKETHLEMKGAVLLGTKTFCSHLQHH